jgi:general nucleoside transport system permease protein
MDSSLLTALASSMVTMAIPLLFTAEGEVVAERAGVINIGLEGMMLTGAFAAMAGTHFSDSVAVGILLALLVGGSLGALLAYFVVRRNANQVVAGTALNLLAAGLTGVAYRASFGVTGTALTIPGGASLPVPLLASLPVVGPAFFAQTPLGYAAFLVVPVLAFAISGTLPGLRLRMVGEHPRAAETQGISVCRTRVTALVICGVLAAAGGAYLAVAYARTFVENMSAGRGFIALAIVIVGRRSAWGVLAAALFFGLVTALQFHFQALGLDIPYQFFLSLPYLLTLLVLAGFAGRTHAPAALGQPYERG